MVRGLVDPITAGNLVNIKTIPRESGSNPNINALLSFKVPLPVEELYCPALSCTVYDQLFMGLSQPTVGTFTIPIGTIMQEQTQKRLDILKKAETFVT